ncbi:MAG: sugar phosphate isomerase/epimerase [Candidatus Latescibacterota bacterium]|nr:MAG: sugar phosphate isomerase/epimerase [Candidatus Latescibacterota bacterium]
MKIGVITSSFRLETRRALETAREIGADGVQLPAVGGDLDPQSLTRTGRQNLLHVLDSLGLEISALCGDLGGGGFVDPADIEWRIERTKQILDLSIDLKTPIVTTHIGVIPQDRDNPSWQTMQEALKELADYAAERECYLAAETGPEEPELMRKFIETVDSQGLKVNYDPANLVMRGFDPIAGVFSLRDYIVHTHAKDALGPDKGPEEVPLGEGDVSFPKYIRTLQENGYDGYLTVEREVGDNPVADIAKAVQFLRNLLARLNQ